MYMATCYRYYNVTHTSLNEWASLYTGCKWSLQYQNMLCKTTTCTCNSLREKIHVYIQCECTCAYSTCIFMYYHYVIVHPLICAALLSLEASRAGVHEQQHHTYMYMYMLYYMHMYMYM